MASANLQIGSKRGRMRGKEPRAERKEKKIHDDNGDDDNGDDDIGDDDNGHDKNDVNNDNDVDDDEEKFYLD